MKPIRFAAERLETLLQAAKVATLPQLKAALGTTVDLTVFRKLSALPYRTSYSHRGAYYTLDTLAQYDELGLWSYQDIHFSRYGTLLDTAATFALGFTVIVNDIGAPVQPLADGVTVIVPDIAVVPALVAVKLGILPVPLAARPIVVLVFVQL